MRIKRLTQLAMLSTVALTIFIIEAQIPALVPLPGIKLGLANIVTVFTVFRLRGRDGVLVLLTRILLGAVFAGNFSTVLYSLAGGGLAIAATIALKPVLSQAQLWIAGTVGAIAHSLGQMAMAVLLTQTPGLLIYLPMMILCSIITGFFTGLCAQFLLKKGEKLWKTFFD